MDPELLSSELIRSFLEEDLKDIDIVIFNCTDSTNIQAKRLASNSAGHGTLVLSEEQTAGRGRTGKSFYSPKSTGLYMSVVLRPENAADTQMITVAAAVSVCRAIEKLLPVKPEIKWVNDIYLGGRKVCGILAEGINISGGGYPEAVILGIGVNCTTLDFPEELKNSAGIIGPISRNRLAAEIYTRVMDISKNLKNPEIIKEYKNRSFIIGKKVIFELNGKTYTGTASDIDEDGSLSVEDDSGNILKLFSGEISIKPL